MAELIHKDECYKIMGACFEVYKEMGVGLHESIYHESLMLELGDRNIPFSSEPSVSVYYKERLLEKKLRPDFIVNDSIVLEIKSVSELADPHRSQVLNYLKITQFKLGLLVNFSAHPKLEWERFANTLS